MLTILPSVCAIASRHYTARPELYVKLSDLSRKLAFSVPAQSDDQKRPPKYPPVRDPKPKPPRDNPPKGDDKPKKPGMSFYLVADSRNSDIA